ncbi:MAG: helix-turn-helix domain-containing protein, partial [Comamonas sp.]
KQLGVEPKRMGTMALHRLQAFDFPGNVRQLENICHWLTVMAPAQQIALKDLPPEVLGGQPLPAMGAVSTVLAALPESPAAQAAQPVAALAETSAMTAVQGSTADAGWLHDLGKHAQQLLAQGHNDVWDQLSQQFEAQLLRTALAATHGRRVEAASRLGIGRNTITRKLQELGLDDESFD